MKNKGRKKFQNFKTSILSQKGVALFLGLVILAILLSIGLAISLILIGQIKMIKGIGDSVIALYAADTGIEKALLLKRTNSLSFSGGSGILENGARYEVTVYGPGPDCTAVNYCIRSVGIYQNTRRAIEVKY